MLKDLKKNRLVYLICVFTTIFKCKYSFLYFEYGYCTANIFVLFPLLQHQQENNKNMHTVNMNDEEWTIREAAR